MVLTFHRHVFIVWAKKKKFWFFFLYNFFLLLWFKSSVVFSLSKLNEDIIKVAQKHCCCEERDHQWEVYFCLLQYLKSGLPKNKSGALFFVGAGGGGTGDRERDETHSCPLFSAYRSFLLFSSWYTSGHFMYTPVYCLYVRPSLRSDEAVVKDCNVKTKVDKKEKNCVTLLFFFCCECLHFVFSCHCVL